MQFTSVLLFSVALSVSASDMRLSDLDPASTLQGWGELQVDRAVGGTPLTIAGRVFDRGIGTHAPSELMYDLNGGFSNFTAWVGADDNLKNHPEGHKASVVFQVFGDDAKLFDSGLMRIGDAAKRIEVPLLGVQTLKLVVTDAGDGKDCDHANWAEATLGGSSTAAPKTVRYTIQQPGFSLSLTEDGEIVGSLIGRSRLQGCRTRGDIRAEQQGNAYVFQRMVEDGRMHRAVVTDIFRPTASSVRWETEIQSEDAPWSAPFETQLKCAVTTNTRFWTAWSDPEQQGGAWRDPLVTTPFLTRGWTYGGRMTSGDFTAIPIATMMETGDDRGISLVVSPEDTHLVGARLSTTPSGSIRFVRSNHRLGGGRVVRFAVDLVFHEADWRGGLRWMTERYPEYFNSPNPAASAMGGCGAYSGAEGPIDVEKFRKMAFRINWKLSDDFPYMGMFIPPVKDADERWVRSCDERAPADKPLTTSCRQLNDYARYMRTNGFYVLNYFNVTEFGKKMGGPPVRKADDDELWKDPRGYLTHKLPGAILRGGNATCYEASAVDPGDPVFQRFILEQAQRHIDLIPDSVGICIDRMDWLDNANSRADDGVSWIGGRAARSLCVSWNTLMKQLGPVIHRAGKVIFVNPIYSRFDLMREVDGIYTEYGQDGRSLNSSALMGVRKPVLGWTYNATLRQPDPDAFMQRHLYLGVYPTAPYPWNNHCITPEASADQLYLDYGSLLDAMRGKKWVLTPHVVETSTTGVKVNLFEVDGGFALPVTFGGSQSYADITVRNLPELEVMRALALHPGAAAGVPLAARAHDGSMTLRVPLVRGCTMVLLRK